MSFEAFLGLSGTAADNAAALLLAYQTGDAAKVIGDLTALASMHPPSLLEYVNLVVEPKEMLTPLHIVSDNSSDAHIAIAGQLIEMKADINRRDRSGATPLHIAAARNNAEVVKILCRREDVRLNVLNPQGFTPLHLAILINGVDSASLLVNAGACLTIPSNNADSKSTQACLISDQHKSAPLEWDFLKKRADCEIKFLECVCDPAISAIFRLLPPMELKRADPRAILRRLIHLVGSLHRRSQQLVYKRPVSTTADFGDMGSAFEDTISTLECMKLESNSKTPEELFRCKFLTLMSDGMQHYSSSSSLPLQQIVARLQNVIQPSSAVLPVTLFRELEGHPLAEAAAKHFIDATSVLQLLDDLSNSAPRLKMKASTLQTVTSMLLWMPWLDALSIRGADVSRDADEGQPIDWLPIFLKDICEPHSQKGSGQDIICHIQKLAINNCKLRPSLGYLSIPLPLCIVELDFSCNPELGLSGVSCILAAIRNHEIVRRLSFSRCTLESNVRDAGASHVSKLTENLLKLTSLQYFDFSFNVFETSQLSRIIASVSTIPLEKLHLCCIELLRDCTQLSSMLHDCLHQLGPSLKNLVLSFNPALVSLPQSIARCELLSYLEISHCNKLKSLPNEVFGPALSVLIANHNPSLEDIGLLPGKSLVLKFVDLSSCTALQTLPDEMYLPTLELLLLTNNTSLKNVAKQGEGILKAVNLKCLELSNCVNLSSLPDELAADSLSNLTSIVIAGCVNMVHPPYGAMNTTQDIKDYLKAAQDSPPLKRVKVVLLGNGRSGKTSLLGSLAKADLNLDCPSTIGVQVDMFSRELQSQRRRKELAKFVGVKYSGFTPELTYWDFAGQLEYSATHDFFMSSRQAVYVIVFSVIEDAASQVEQVRYWLNTILERHSKYNRIIVVGTKIDTLDSHLEVSGSQDVVQREKNLMVKLQRFKMSMQQSIQALACHYELNFEIPIFFATANTKHFLWSNLRKQLKSQISRFSNDIFEGCDRQLRFPAAHKALLDEVQELTRCNPQKPIFSLNDDSITERFKLLHALRGTPDSRSLQSLKVLSDVGFLVHYNCRGQDYICPTPQYVAHIISLLADPGRICQPIISKPELLEIIYLNSDITKCHHSNEQLANQLIDFMMAIRLLTLTNASDGSKETQFLIPLQLRGRPSFWQQCEIPVNIDAIIKAVRFKLLRGIVTVPSFLRLISEYCHDILHMWGCAFITKVGEGQNVFVRLSEDRSSVDVISLVFSAEAAESTNQLNATVAAMISMLKLSPENSIELHLCPHCVVSNHYMRSGLAHEFHKKQLGRFLLHPGTQSEFIPWDRVRLNCRRHHDESAANIVLGTKLHFRGSEQMPLLYPGTQSDFIPWISVSEAGITAFMQLDGRHQDARSGIVLHNSFFALSRQLQAGSKIDRATLDQLLSAMCANAPAVPIEIGGDLFQLLLQYSVGDCIGADKISRIINFRLPLVVASSAASQAGANAHSETVVTVTTPHGLSERQPLVVDFKNKSDVGEYGHGAVVSQIVDDYTFIIEPETQAGVGLADWDTSHRVHVKPGAKLYTVRPSFSFADNVIVVFDKVHMENDRPNFVVFPGCPSGFEVAFLTQQCCSGSDKLGGVWTEVEDNWAVMLGNEYQNYEIDSVILFRQRARDQQFLEEVNWLKTVGQARPNPYKHPYESFNCPADNAVQRVQRSSLQHQVLKHFHDFSSKFCLLPALENEGLNLSVVWWGNLPEAHHTVAQNGFQHLPPALKIDPGYFGDGFYLTRYPRYSDYYISGCKLASRDISGCILMCFAALGRPYPVTQNPFEYTSGQVVKTKESLVGQPCGQACNCYSGSHADRVPNHDSHYASVKFQPLNQNPALKSFFPCPLRQEPEYDEIVIFKSERVVPAAHVSFKRRSRVLLWLDEEPLSSENVKVKRATIPGYAEQHPEEAQSSHRKTQSVVRGTGTVSRGSASFVLLEAGCSDSLVRELHQSIAGVQGQQLAWETGLYGLDVDNKATSPQLPRQLSDDYSGALDSDTPVLLHEFSTVNDITDFLCHHPEFIRYPPSLFRIITSRRMFIGSNGLSNFLDNDPVWSFTFPSTMVFYRDDQDHSLATATASRPNFWHTTSAATCCAYASFVELKRA